ncbi:MAG: tellurite resistance/C4-dicarboxylate transporter family protein [Acetobacteraceae bacterium]|nr:tellurite resistance/C4-dicarboxylate transporter family protein [Acetobacteraceae bacterium]
MASGPAWLRDFYPGYFALVMATGIVDIAARLLGYQAVALPLLAISLAAYLLLWAVLVARLALFPRAVLADFRSHQRGPGFLTIVAATGVIGGELGDFRLLAGVLPPLFWFSLALWVLLVYGFLSTATVGSVKPDLEQGLNGSWLLLTVATESVAILACSAASRAVEPQALAFAGLAFYLLGAVLYLLIITLILLRWMFRPMLASDMDEAWWINMGAVAIATLAGARLMSLPNVKPNLLPLLDFAAPFTVLLWVTSTFWIPLLAVLFVRKLVQRKSYSYSPSLWSMVFPLGMYTSATREYAAAVHLPFLRPIPRVMFWVALLAWLVTFAAMCARLVRSMWQPAATGAA